MSEAKREAKGSRTILLWRFEDAPEEYRRLSDHGGDEDWVAFVPDGISDEHYIPWENECDVWFGCCSIGHHKVDGGMVHIGAHA